MYWGGSQDLVCNDLTIHLQSEHKLLDYMIRTLTVTKVFSINFLIFIEFEHKLLHVILSFFYLRTTLQRLNEH